MIGDRRPAREGRPRWVADVHVERTRAAHRWHVVAERVRREGRVERADLAWRDRQAAEPARRGGQRAGQVLAHPAEQLAGGPRDVRRVGLEGATVPDEVVAVAGGAADLATLGVQPVEVVEAEPVEVVRVGPDRRPQAYPGGVHRLATGDGDQAGLAGATRAGGRGRRPGAGGRPAGPTAPPPRRSSADRPGPRPRARGRSPAAKPAWTRRGSARGRRPPARRRSGPAGSPARAPRGSARGERRRTPGRRPAGRSSGRPGPARRSAGPGP